LGRQILQNGDEIQQLVVVSIREPTANRHGMLWMKDIACRGVIDDDGILKVTTKLGEILQ